MGKWIRHKNIWCVLLILCFLTGCGNTDTQPTTERVQPDSETEVVTEDPVPMSEVHEEAASGNEEPPENFTPYEAPPFADAVFHETEAVDGVQLDLSSTADGYVAIAATSESRLKFQVLKDEVTYTYNIASDGTPSIFPLQCGDGHYTFRVMENVVDTKYAVKMTTEADVVLSDEFQPYLRPSDYVNYSQTSQCVSKASELAAQAEDELGVVSEVFDYICSGVTYDKEKAANVGTDYLPNPDETLATGKGICFDYASLAAAMLRSQGIPTQVIFGYVSPNDLYHAWNMFYTEETGWVTVDYQVSQDTWNRLDLTFSANGADENFIGDGGNYADVYIY